MAGYNAKEKHQKKKPAWAAAALSAATATACLVKSELGEDETE